MSESVIPQELIRAIKSRNVVMMVGAGFSLEAGMPNTMEIMGTLCEDMNIEMTESDSFEVIAEIYENSKGRVELCRILSHMLTNDKIKLSEGHRIFGRIVRRGYFNTIITTNYDNVLEEAIGSAPKVRRIMTDSPFPYLEHEEVKLVKYHGSIERESTLVISERDYFASFNERRKLHDYLSNIFRTYDLLIIGFSMNDFDFSFLFHNLRYDQNRFSRRAFMVGPRKNSKRWRIEKTYYWERKNICMIEMTASTFFRKLEALLD